MKKPSDSLLKKKTLEEHEYLNCQQLPSANLCLSKIGDFGQLSNFLNDCLKLE